MSKGFYIHGSFWSVGSKCSVKFEHKVFLGILHDFDEDRRVVGVKGPDGSIAWAHETFVTMGVY